MKETEVLSAAKQLILVEATDLKGLILASQNYVEVVCNSSSDELKQMLTNILSEHYVAFPFWARLMAFRLACALNPNDINLKDWAISDISAFGGPDWVNKVNW